MKRSLLAILMLIAWAGIASAQASYGVPSSGVGACASGKVVSALNQNAPPTCVPSNSAAVNPQTYGADPTGTTDSGTAINNAISASRNGSVQFPAGTYLIDTPINLTGKVGNRFIGPQSQSNLSLGGQATFVCNTGSRPCIDETGSNGVSIEHVVLKSGNTSPSCVGILQARTSAGGAVAQQNTFDNVTTLFTTGLGGSCNSGKGTIGIYNYAAELSDYHNVYLQTDTPVVFSSQNTLGVTSPYQSIASGAQSMTEVSFSGMPTIVSSAGPDIWVDGSLGHLDLGDGYLLGCASAGCGTSAILINGALNYFQWHGRLENNGGTRIPFELGIGSLLLDADVQSVLDGGNGAAFRMDDGSGGNCPTIQSSTFRIENDALSGSTNMVSENGSGCTAAVPAMFAVHFLYASGTYNNLTITKGATAGQITTESWTPANVSLPSGYEYRNNTGSIGTSDLNGAVNVLAHGAVCDGVTDNTISLQASITAAENISGTGVGEVDIPASCNTSSGHALYIASGITIPDNTMIRGLGGSCYVNSPCVEILCGATSGSCVTSTSTHGAGLQNVALKTTATGSSGLRLDGTFEFNLRGSAISGFTANGLWITDINSSAIYNFIANNNISNNNLDLFLDGAEVGSSAHSIGDNEFLNDQFTSSTGTYNIVGTSYSSSAGSAGYQSVYQNDFTNIDISQGNGSATIGFQSNAMLNTTLANITAESLNTQFQLNAGTNNFDVRGVEGAILGTSSTDIFTATGDATYNICMGYLAGVGGSKCYSTMPKLEQYIETTSTQDITGQIGSGLRENRITHSEDFTNGAWTNSGITGTSNTATSPAGVANGATAAVLTPSGAAFFQQIYSLGSSIANTCWTGSVWMQTASGTARPQLILYDAAGTQLSNGGLSSGMVTTTWHRFYVTGCASGSDSQTGVKFRPLYFSANAPTATINLWGAQLSETNGPIRYVKTVGSVITDDVVGITTASLNIPGVLVANLPASCQPNDVRAVSDWNGTNGTCTGGGSNYTIATCGGSNTWYCP